MRQNRKIQANRCYHLVSRIAHQAFFMDEEERDRFVDLLFRAAAFSCVKLIGFCIMSNHIHIYVYLPADRKLTEGEIYARICTLYRGTRLEELLKEWDMLKADDERLCAQPGGKVCASDFDELKLSYQRRMFHPSEFMKTLKQHYTMSFNGRHRHTGTLWESRFNCRETRPVPADMSAVAAYIDCNPVEGGICSWPTSYPWCSWTMATNGDLRARQMYAFVYADATESWQDIVDLHEKAIKKRIGDIEEACRSDRRAGVSRTAPSGVVPVAPPERYSIQLEGGKGDVAETILALLKASPLSAAEIGEALGMKSRHHLTTKYLQPLLRLNLIVQTIPDNPKAPNQKYKAAS